MKRVEREGNTMKEEILEEGRGERRKEERRGGVEGTGE